MANELSNVERVLGWVGDGYLHIGLQSFLLEDGSEVEHLDVSLPVLLSGVFGLHGEDAGLAVLLDPLHDHARPADLALPHHQLHLLVVFESLPHCFHRLVDVDVVHPLEL